MRTTIYDKERALNWIRVLIDTTCISAKTLSLPPTVWFRISTACDLECLLCPRQYISPVDSGFMPFDKFKELIGKMVGIERAGLYGLGEPFLNKRLFDYVDVCHSLGMFANTSTNGMHFKEETLERIVGSGLEELSVSMDASTPELFNRLRKGADFDVVCRGVRRLAELKAEKGTEHPYLLIAYTVSKENVHDLEAMVRLTHEMGGNGVCFLDTVAPVKELLPYCINDSEDFQENYPKAVKAGEQLGVNIEHFRQKPMPKVAQPVVAEGVPMACNMLWASLIIERLGTSLVCCYIDDPGVNAFECSLSEVINSKDRVQMRQALIEGRLRDECRGCPSLIVNSFSRVEEILQDAAQQIETGPFENEEKGTLRKIIAGYRSKARELLPETSPEETQSKSSHLLGKLVPRNLRKAIRSTISRFS